MSYKEVIEVIFSLGLFINAVSFIPQIARLIKDRSAKGISLITFTIFLLTQFSAVLYGFIIHSWILIIGYMLSMLTCGPVVLLIIYFRCKRLDDTEHSTNIAGISFEDIVKQSPLHIYWKDLSGRCLGGSDQQYKSLGLKSSSDFIGKTDFDLYPIDQAAKIVEADKAILLSGKSQAVEEVANTGDGQQALYLSYKAALKNKQGRTVGLVGVSVDITDARRQEVARKEFLENIIALMPGHVYWVDREGVYQGCNDEQAKSAGLAARENIIGKRNADLPWNLHSNVVPELLDKVNDGVMACGKSKMIEEPAKLNNGTTKTFLSSKVPLKDSEDRVIGLLGISVDITDRKTIESELIKAKEKAEVANKAKEEFLYNMRHDIRTPFSGITGMATLLRDQETDKDKLCYIDHIYNSADELLDYLNAILEFTQLEEGTVPVVSRLTNLKETVQSCIAMFMPAMELKGINFIFDYDEVLLTEYYTDEFRIKRIVINLLGNAVKFTPKAGSIKLNISLPEEKSALTQPLIRLSVQDTGIGIPLEKQGLIFEKFERLTSSYKGEYKGTGLGLHAVKTLIEDLDGDVTVFSEVGQGATFTCSVPMRKPASGENIFSEEKDDGAHTFEAKFSLESPDILLVEDGEIMQLAFSSLLTGLNCSVDIAATGEEAVKMCQEKSYNLIYMDIGLPGIDGFEATRQIKQLSYCKGVPVIALTAHATNDVDEQCKASGMDSVISKPLTKDKAIGVLNEFIKSGTTLALSEGLQEITAGNYVTINASIIDMRDSIRKLGNENETTRYLLLLKASLIASLKTISDFVIKKDIKNLDRELHKLKGALSLVTVPQLQRAIENFNTCSAGEVDLSIEDQYQQLKLQLDCFSEELEKIMSVLDEK
jgi:two-component system, OmpR family, aerobic respiration control sensor histidine kinase ArcB